VSRGILFDQLIWLVVGPDRITFAIDLLEEPGDPGSVFVPEKINLDLLHLYT
jgi:hypothetical protein